MTRPLVSIIITCYNQAPIIQRAIKSIIDQTYQNWECIVVDDGSTDNSASKIKELSRINSQIKYIHQQNKGVSSARNLGFSISKGDYIQFLDGDDWLLPTKLDKQILHFNSNLEIDVSYTKHSHYLEVSKQYKTFEFEILEKNPLEQFLFRWSKGVSLPLHVCLYRRSLWAENELPYPTDYFGREEDWIFNISVALKKANYGYFDEVLCIYYIGEHNFTNSLLNICIYNIESAIYIQKLIPDNHKSEFLRTAIKNSIIRYKEGQSMEILKASGNWRLGNFLTKPIFILKKIINSIRH